MKHNRTLLDHPIALFSLFATEMWERFNYYGMRAILMLFLTATLASGGFGMEENEALLIYGLFTSLVYVTPILGGLLSDKILGQRKTIYIGALTMAFGQLILTYAATLSPENIEFKQMIFYYGLGILIMGNGFFKPNISTMVGELYSANDPRRDSAFTIFYMGINLGAMIGPLIAGWLAENDAFGRWEYGFLASSVAMFIGFTWFFFSREILGTVGMPPKYKALKAKLTTKDRLDIMYYVLAILVGVFTILYLWSLTPQMARNILVGILFVGGFAYLATNIIKGTSGKTEWSRVGVILVLAVFNIIFWSGYEQSGGTFNIFARDHIDRMLGSFEIPTTWFQSVSAISIVVFASFFSMMWVWLDKIKLNPNTPAKFVWGIVFLSFAFVIIAIGNERTNGGTHLISPIWLVMVYIILTWGELCLSPIGLSMVTKLSPPKIVSTMMGVWMGSIAFANYLAASMKRIAEHFDFPVFWFIASITAIAALLLLALTPWLKKMMKGIK